MTSPHKKIPPAFRFRVNRRLIDGRLTGSSFLKARSSMRPLMVRGETEVVIDGFPRSANSYAYYAFKQANPRTSLSGHTHSAQTLRTAVRQEIPTFLLVRAPRPTVASLMQFVPGLEAGHALDAYVRFHRGCLPVVGGVVVATFDQVIRDFGTVISAGNQRWGTDFVEYKHDAAGEATVFKDLSVSNERYYGGHEHTAARPSSVRREVEVVLGSLDRHATSTLREAELLFAELSEHAMP